MTAKYFYDEHRNRLLVVEAKPDASHGYFVREISAVEEMGVVVSAQNLDVVVEGIDRKIRTYPQVMPWEKPTEIGVQYKKEPAAPVVKIGKWPTKPCCGSKGARHKRECIENGKPSKATHEELDLDRPTNSGTTEVLRDRVLDAYANYDPEDTDRKPNFKYFLLMTGAKSARDLQEVIAWLHHDKKLPEDVGV